MMEALCWWNHTAGMTSPFWISVFALWNLLSYFAAMGKCQMWSENLTSQVGIQGRLFKARLHQAGRKCKERLFCSNRMPLCLSLSSLLTARSLIWPVTTNIELHQGIPISCIEKENPGKTLLPTHLHVERPPRHVLLPFVPSLSKEYREIKSYSELFPKLLTNKSDQDLAGAL